MSAAQSISSTSVASAAESVREDEKLTPFALEWLLDRSASLQEPAEKVAHFSTQRRQFYDRYRSLERYQSLDPLSVQTMHNMLLRIFAEPHNLPEQCKQSEATFQEELRQLQAQFTKTLQSLAQWSRVSDEFRYRLHLLNSLEIRLTLLDQKRAAAEEAQQQADKEAQQQADKAAQQQVGKAPQHTQSYAPEKEPQPVQLHAHAKEPQQTQSYAAQVLQVHSAPPHTDEGKVIALWNSQPRDTLPDLPAASTLIFPSPLVARAQKEQVALTPQKATKAQSSPLPPTNKSQVSPLPLASKAQTPSLPIKAPSFPTLENAAASALSNRRSAPRLRLATDITIGQEEHCFFTGFSENISSGGIFIATYEQLPTKGSTYELRFSLATGEIIQTEVEVMWTRDFNEQSPDTSPGFGCRFLRLSPEEQQRINHYIAKEGSLFMPQDEDLF